jgi:hypothetical protein
MRNALALLAVIAATVPASAFGLDLNPAIPTEHAREARYADTDAQRYPMSWSDEAAQRLGVRNGKWEAFSTTPSSRLEPSVSAGADAGGAMLKLQWR